MKLIKRQGNKLIENGDGCVEFEIPGELELLLKYAVYSTYTRFEIYNIEINNILGGGSIPVGLDPMVMGFEHLLTWIWKTPTSGNSTQPASRWATHVTHQFLQLMFRATTLLLSLLFVLFHIELLPFNVKRCHEIESVETTF
jgi:hypothetical protein